MMRSFTAVSAFALLIACGDGQPFIFEGQEEDEGDRGTVEIELQGTEEPQANRSIRRIEPDAGNGVANETGGGLVRSASYDANTDTYLIDNLAFDGENTYVLDSAVPVLGDYNVYEADETVADLLTGAQVDQIVPYRAVTGRSSVDVDGNPRTSFAIVRTGGYSGFGFGGFVYERNGGVVLPTAGQAQWEGTYAGVRVFDPDGRLEFTEGDMYIAIDFDDFNTNNGVVGVVENRVGYDENGTILPTDVDGEPLLPAIGFVVLQGVDTLLPTGELTGELRSNRINDAGEIAVYEDGKYFALIAGNTLEGDGGEIVGTFVVESADPRLDGLRVQETGGFLLPRAQ